MRKPFIIAFLAVYLVLTTGFTVLIHTCGGYSTVEAIPLSTEDPCGCMDENESCCTLEIREFQIDGDQKAATVELPQVKIAEAVHFADETDALSGAEGLARPFIPDRPSSPVIPLHILHCTLLI